MVCDHIRRLERLKPLKPHNCRPAKFITTNLTLEINSQQWDSDLLHRSAQRIDFEIFHFTLFSKSIVVNHWERTTRTKLKEPLEGDLISIKEED